MNMLMTIRTGDGPFTKKTLIFGGDFICCYLQYKQISPKHETAKFILEFSKTINNKFTHGICIELLVEKITS